MRKAENGRLKRCYIHGLPAGVEDEAWLSPTRTSAKDEARLRPTKLGDREGAEDQTGVVALGRRGVAVRAGNRAAEGVPDDGQRGPQGAQCGGKLLEFFEALGDGEFIQRATIALQTGG